MIRPITRIATNERSEAVSNLRAAMQVMGFRVAPDEDQEQRAQ